MEKYLLGSTLLIASAFPMVLSPLALCQTNSMPSSTTPPAITASSSQMPAYEVATIKPAPPGRFHYSLRRSISSAFGFPPNTTWGVIGGPDWIGSADYVIQGKPPDTIRDAMQTMTSEQRDEEFRLMRQGLLADRFQLKAHFETRELRVFELTVAKGGSKLRENPHTTRVNGAAGPSMIHGTASSMNFLLGALQSAPEMQEHPLIDKTRLSGTYDFLLRWAPMQPTAAVGDVSGAAPPPDTERVSLFTAIEEQLGLKLVPTKGPVRVLVIDHIERPTEN